MSTLLRRFALAAAVALPLALMVATPALAHERRAVGPYSFLVGWNTEPPYEDQPNAVQLTVTMTDANGAGVDGAQNTLQVAITCAPECASLGIDPSKQTETLPFVEDDSTVGLYTAAFVPTEPGPYQFHITGTLGGTPIDQTFSSGPNTFEDLGSLAPGEFPITIPSGRELQSAVTGASTAAQQAQAAVSTAATSAQQAKSAASSAQTMAIIAIVAAVVLGGGALAMGMRKH